MTFCIGEIERNTAGIYCMICYPTGDAYIGSTKNLLDRFRQHVVGAKTGDADMYRIMRALGAENFHFEVLHHWTGTNEDRREMERALLFRMLPTMNKNIGIQRDLDPSAYEAFNPKAVKEYSANMAKPKKERPPFRFNLLSQYK